MKSKVCGEGEHVYRVLGSVTKKQHDAGDTRFSEGFDGYSDMGIPVSVARRKVCKICGQKITTVEIESKSLLKMLQPELRKKARRILIQAAKSQVPGQRNEGVIAYSELYPLLFPNDPPWSPANHRRCTKKVEAIVIEVANENLEREEPPLNALVVRLDTLLPGEGWSVWAHEMGFGMTAAEAQVAIQECEWP